MKKRIFVTVLLIIFIFGMINVDAASQRMVDNADLLTELEENSIESKLDGLSAKHGLDIVIVTVDSTDGKSVKDYADDYYDHNGYREDGILLLIGMDDRDWWISTTGYGITVFTDAGLDYISDRFVPYLSDGEYSEAFTVFADLCDSFIIRAGSDDPYDHGGMPDDYFDSGEYAKEPYDIKISLVISLLIGLASAFIGTGIMKGQLNTVRPQNKADNYVKADSMKVTRSRDLYLYSHVSKRLRPQNNSGSSSGGSFSRGSSVHRSSSGRSHGGRGGKF